MVGLAFTPSPSDTPMFAGAPVKPLTPAMDQGSSDATPVAPAGKPPPSVTLPPPAAASVPAPAPTSPPATAPAIRFNPNDTPIAPAPSAAAGAPEEAPPVKPDAGDQPVSGAGPLQSIEDWWNNTPAEKAPLLSAIRQGPSGVADYIKNLPHQAAEWWRNTPDVLSQSAQTHARAADLDRAFEQQTGTKLAPGRHSPEGWHALLEDPIAMSFMPGEGLHNGFAGPRVDIIPPDGAAPPVAPAARGLPQPEGPVYDMEPVQPAAPPSPPKGEGPAPTTTPPSPPDGEGASAASMTPPPETPQAKAQRAERDLAAWMDGKRPPAEPLHQPELQSPVTVTLPDGTKARGIFQGREGDNATVAFFDEPTNPEGIRGKTVTSSARAVRFAPLELTEGEQNFVEAHEAATSPLNDKPEPTPAQQEAGNYPKGHITVQGLDVSIENPQGSTRSGIGPDGQPWAVTLQDHYGYIRKTEGADGDHVDAYIGPNPKSSRVFLVDQIDPATGKFDEHKALVGFNSQAEALAAYARGFSDGSGPERLGAMTTMPMPGFKRWLKTGDTTKPLKYQEPESAPAQVISPVPEPAPPGRAEGAAPVPTLKGENVKISNVDVHDAHGGEMFGTKALTVDGKTKAAADISIYRGEVRIQNIVTAADARRSGLATRLVDDLFREFPEKKISISSTTDDGSAFFRSRFNISDDGVITPKSERSRKAAPTFKGEPVEARPKVQSFEEFAAQNDASAADFGEPGMHRGNSSVSEAARKRALDGLAARQADLAARREALRPEYDAAVERGDIRPPTAAERLERAAQGHEDNPSTQAARSVLEKRKAAASGPALHPSTGKIADLLATSDLRPKVADIAKAGKMTVEDAKRTLQYLAGKGGLIKQTGVNTYRKLPRRSTPLDLIEFLASKGGIKDQGGELAARDLGKKFVPGIGKLVRKSGRSLDEARELAQEAGYLPRDNPDRPSESDINVLLDAIDRTNHGKRVYREADEKEVAETGEKAMLERERDEMEHHAGSLGIDVKPEMTRDEIIEAIRVAEREEALKKPDHLITPEDHAALDEEREALVSEGMRDDSISDEERAYLEREFAEPQEASGPPSEHPGETLVSDEAEERPGLEEGDRDRREAGPGREAPNAESVPRASIERTRPTIDQTDQGAQPVIPGAERLTAEEVAASKRADEKKRAELQMNTGKLRSDKPQEGPTQQQGSLFGEEPGRAKQGSLFDVGQPTPRLVSNRLAIRAAIHAEIQRLVPGATANILDRHTFKYGDQTVELGGSYADGIINVSLASSDPIRTATHEALHMMRDIGVIKPAEWETLAKVSRERWMPEYEIEQHYGPHYRAAVGDAAAEERLVEEGVAHAFSDFNPNDARAWAKAKLPPIVFNVFKRLANFFASIRAMLAGHGFHSLDDAFKVRGTFEDMQSGEVGKRPWQHDPYAEASAIAAEERARGAPLAEIKRPDEPAEFPPGTDHAKPGRALIESAGAFLRNLRDDLQMKVAPMAVGSDRARVIAKTFANNLRVSQFRWTRADEFLVKNFTPEQRRAMWRAGDEQSVIEQTGEEYPPSAGLGGLKPEERVAVDDLHAAGEPLWEHAKRVGIVTGEGLPSYMPRMLVVIGEDGSAGRLNGGRSGPSGGPPSRGRGLDTMGRNLTTAGPKGRKYLFSAETESAARKIDRGAGIVEDIRTLPLAYSRLERAIAGKELINSIKEIGEWSGEPTVFDGEEPGTFTMDHPAFQVYRPRMRERGEPGSLGGKYEPVMDDAGNPVFDRMPIYVSREFEGPLRAVLTKESGAIYNAFMALKAKTMSVIMYSPLIHNEVEWGRAFGLMPSEMLKVGTARMPLPGGYSVPAPVPRIYRDGYRLKQDPALMIEAIRGGLVPIGHRGFNQDITGIAEGPNLKPGRSLTAKVIGGPIGLVNEKAGTAVKRGIDYAGDIWHNTLLWDRVADLQMGLYQRILEKGLKQGLSRQEAVIVAAHEANRFAGALPNESMSAGARKAANFILFSRSFTLGNLGAMKDATGLPRDLQAMLKSSGADAEAVATAGKLAASFGRRKATYAIIKDIALNILGLALVQSAVNLVQSGGDWEKEKKGLADRWHRLVKAAEDSLWNVVNPLADLHALSPTAENEPGKENRVDIGANAKGTEIYARLPTGKIGEELEGYLTTPLEMLRRKVGTVMRPLIEIYNNDMGFGRKVYDPNDPMVKEVADVVLHVLLAQAPVDALKGIRDIYEGTGDRNTNIAKAAGPLAGITVSQGAPGGKVVGELYAAEKEHFDKVRNAMPDINKKIEGGDLDGAVQDMIALGMNRYQIRATIAHAENPASRASKGKMRNLQLFMTPEQRGRMDRLLNERSATHSE